MLVIAWRLIAGENSFNKFWTKAGKKGQEASEVAKELGWARSQKKLLVWW